MSNIKDNTQVKVDGHVLITDVDSGIVLLDKHNDINYENIALAMANTLTTTSDSSGRPFAIKRMVFGNGGTSVDNNGNVVYNAVNVAGLTDTLYNRSYHKVLDNTMIEIIDTQGQPISAIKITAVLDYAEPATQDVSDGAPTTNGEYTFDEMAITLESGESGSDVTQDGLHISHIVFHPVQKTANRKITVEYTITISAGA